MGHGQEDCNQSKVTCKTRFRINHHIAYIFLSCRDYPQVIVSVS